MGKEIEEIKIEEEFVDMIASGYEWECPNCGHLNKEIEICNQVDCEKCDRTFLTGGYADHAYH